MKTLKHLKKCYAVNVVNSEGHLFTVVRVNLRCWHVYAIKCCPNSIKNLKFELAMATLHGSSPGIWGPRSEHAYPCCFIGSHPERINSLSPNRVRFHYPLAETLQIPSKALQGSLVYHYPR